ncbi:hypothetical protein SDC9_152813 [bioreactor metagenome]|uniref:Uncharacterized protein n=1 Tax=bioreactor metagenome TaxID=1076179 RepID=A0A645EWF6_9ZZZZ
MGAAAQQNVGRALHQYPLTALRQRQHHGGQLPVGVEGNLSRPDAGGNFLPRRLPPRHKILQQRDFCGIAQKAGLAGRRVVAVEQCLIKAPGVLPSGPLGLHGHAV